MVGNQRPGARALQRVFDGVASVTLIICNLAFTDTASTRLWVRYNYGARASIDIVTSTVVSVGRCAFMASVMVLSLYQARQRRGVSLQCHVSCEAEY